MDNFNFNHKKILIISTGPSTSKLTPEHLKHYDYVLGVNHSVFQWDKHLTHHMVIEDRPLEIINKMCRDNHNPNIPRIISPVSAHLFPQRLKLVPTERKSYTLHTFTPFDSSEGLIGSLRPNFNFGTVTLQALHYSLSVLKAKEIHFIGAEHRWKGNSFNQHYFGNPGTVEEGNKIVMERKGVAYMIKAGKGYNSTQPYIDTANSINLIYKELLKPRGIELVDFSNGLLECEKGVIR